MEILDTPESQPDAWRRPEEILENGYNFDVGLAVSEGFDMFKKELWLFVGYTVVVLIIGIASAVIPLATVILAGPLNAGFIIAAHKIQSKEEIEFGTFFKGFDRFLPLMLYSIVSGVLIAVGIILLVIPGIYLAVAYLIAIPFVYFYHEIGFWKAMELCRKAVTQNWWSFFGLAIVNILIALAGALALGIGILFATPLIQCILYAAFRQVSKNR